MLDVITDFWKPVKKVQPPEKLNPDVLQLGSNIGFGFVPQPLLSGKRLSISAINTYQFGDETLTSFVLAQEKESASSALGISMIVAESEGEHYLAISRRISISDRMKLFESRDLENIMDNAEITKLACKDGGADFKGWTVSAYKREIQGLNGRIYKGDFRKHALPESAEGQEFKYFLLVSDSNEHAIEIEKYHDGRVEVYSTIYRRMNDIGEISHAPRAELSPPDVKLVSNDKMQAPKEQPVLAAPANTNALPTAAAISPALVAAEKPTQPTNILPDELASAANLPTEQQTFKENPPMATPESVMNGAAKDATMPSMVEHKPHSPMVHVQQTAPQSYLNQEVKAVSNPDAKSFENDSIECDLRVANKIIDEAIRNEMRLTDVVRRIIELPVAYPESVQIPMTLTDEDFALLAIRYGITPSDRNAIKRRILEDLNDFSGEKKKAA